jgi:hypothetical protein
LLPQPTAWPQPASPKSAHVFGTHGTHALLEHTSPPSQGEQVRWTPQPRSTVPHPVTVPASMASSQVDGVQQLPPVHVSPVPHVPQLTLAPQALVALPHVAAPQVGAAHDVHVPPVQCVPVGQPLHCTLPLPQAFATAPHLYPASSFPHSGGGGLQTPAMHC